MNPRLAACQALAAVLAGRASLSGALPPQLDKVAPRDRGLTQELAFGAARGPPRLQAQAARRLQKPFKAADTDIHALLLIGLYQLLYTRIPPHAAIGETVGCADKLKKGWAKGVLNAVLRRAQREGETLLAEVDRDPSARLGHPRWLLKALKQAWPNLPKPGSRPAPATTAATASSSPRRATYANYRASRRAASASRTKPRNWPPSCSKARPASVSSTPAVRLAARPATCWKPNRDWPKWSPSTSRRAAW